MSEEIENAEELDKDFVGKLTPKQRRRYIWQIINSGLFISFVMVFIGFLAVGYWELVQPMRINSELRSILVYAGLLYSSVYILSDLITQASRNINLVSERIKKRVMKNIKQENLDEVMEDEEN